MNSSRSRSSHAPSSDVLSYQARPASLRSAEELPQPSSHRSFSSCSLRQQPSASWSSVASTRMAFSAFHLVQNGRSNIMGSFRGSSPTPDLSSDIRAQRASLSDSDDFSSVLGDVGGGLSSFDHARFTAHDLQTAPVTREKPSGTCHRSRNNRSPTMAERAPRFQALGLQQDPSDEIQLEEVDTSVTLPSPRWQGDGEPDMSVLVGQKVRHVQQHRRHSRLSTQTHPSALPPRGTASAESKRFQETRAEQQQVSDELSRSQGLPSSPLESPRRRMTTSTGLQHRPVPRMQRPLWPDRSGKILLGANSLDLEEKQRVLASATQMLTYRGRASVEETTPADLLDSEETLQMQARASLQHGEPEKFNKQSLRHADPKMAGRDCKPVRSQSMSLGCSQLCHPSSADVSDAKVNAAFVGAGPPFKSKLQKSAALPTATKAWSQRSSPAQHPWKSPQDSVPRSSRQFNPAPSSSPSGFESECRVANLVAKLIAIDRNDQAAAMAKIDSILRAEIYSKGAGGPELPIKMTPAAVPSPPLKLVADEELRRSYFGCQEHYCVEEEEEEETTESESDEGTSISSMTNPTYVGHEYLKDAREGPTPNMSTSTFRRPRPSKLGSYMGGRVDRAMSPPLQDDRQVKMKSRKLRSPPPPMIKVSVSVKAETAGRSFDENSSVYATMQSAPKDSKLNQFMSEQPQVVVTGADAQPIAAKIHNWDEMSNKDGQAGQSQAALDVSLETDELGSILTPSQSSSVDAEAIMEATSSGSPCRFHPWNSHKSGHEIKAKEDTSMSVVNIPVATPQPVSSRMPSKDDQLQPQEETLHKGSDSFEAFLNGVASGLRDGDVPSPASLIRASPRLHEPRQVKMTNDFPAEHISAWFALPSSSFFAAGSSSSSKDSDNDNIKDKSSFKNQRWSRPSSFEQKPSLPGDVASAFPSSINLKESALPISPSVALPSLPEDVASVFSSSINLKKSALPIAPAVALPKEEMEPPASQTRKSRRSFLGPLLKRNKKSAPRESTLSKPVRFSFSGTHAARNKNKPLLTAYAMDSLVTEKETSTHFHSRSSRSLSPDRRRSKLPFTRRLSPSLLDETADTVDESASLESRSSHAFRFARKFSRLMKIYD